jgi:hypothetical protein
VRRGLAGRVGQGLNAGGRAYGYAPVAGEKGKRTIIEAEAEIVRRIFDEYLAGRTPREIARDLNDEGILPPRGRLWNASTINGCRPSLECPERRAEAGCNGAERRTCGLRYYLAPTRQCWRYEQQLVHLQDALSKGINAGDSEAAEAIRDLVETVTVFRDSSRPGGVTVEIDGRLNALLGEQAYPNKVRGVWGKMVAGEGLEPPTPGL